MLRGCLDKSQSLALSMKSSALLHRRQPPLAAAASAAVPPSSSFHGVFLLPLIPVLLCVQTIALIAVREGVVQLGSMKKVRSQLCSLVFN
jgi:hypothetical protein